MNLSDFLKQIEDLGEVDEISNWPEVHYVRVAESTLHRLFEARTLLPKAAKVIRAMSKALEIEDWEKDGFPLGVEILKILEEE